MVETPACLAWATVAVFAYVCAGEIIPCMPGIARVGRRLLPDWAVQQLLLIAIISGLAVLLTSNSAKRHCGGLAAAKLMLKWLNLVPVAAAVLTTYSFPLSDICPFAEASDSCDYLDVVLNAVGLLSARLARLNLGISLLLATRGGSSLMFGATGLGFPEAIPLHWEAGWWCAGHSALHSVAYMLFYLHDGGFRSLWLNCFPAPLPDGAINTLGLVNGLGILAFICSLALVVPAMPWIRQRYYNAFQRLHLPVAALFVVCCALHDLPILFFALPGLAGWYLERIGPRTSSGLLQPLRARACVLPGTSGPWVELAIDCGVALRMSSDFPQWVSVRVLPLGRERHPLSVAAITATATSTELNLLVTASAGDWSQALAALCQEEQTVEVEMNGPYPVGSGVWYRGLEPVLFVVAGGTGITKWLPTLVAAADANRRCHLIWCVRTQGDYLALSPRLPYGGQSVMVTVFVTRPAGGDVAEDPNRTVLERCAEEAEVANPRRAEVDVHADEESQGRDLGGEEQVLQGPQYRKLMASSSAMTKVLLSAILVALAVAYWGWGSASHALGPQVSLPAFLLLKRCLPIFLILAPVVVMSHLSDCGCRLLASATRTVLRSWFDTLEEVDQDMGTETGPTVPLLPPAGEEWDVSIAYRGHRLLVGRPCIDSFLRSVVEALETRHLVVAACGPGALNEAVRCAVVAAKKEHPSVRFEFRGSDPHW